MKPGKHQKRKQRCQDLCWKIHNHSQSFVLLSFTMPNLTKTTHFYWLVPQYGGNSYCVLCMVNPEKRTETYNKEL